ncbi:apoptosis regulator E8 [Equid gammaherpesvirus 2]|nr:apoptosis regulator E8 [Equid gammaherpesvirus 2]UTM05478.1 apoptosis regulator E8 [Equid gammaherpesvirus 2]
MSHYSMIDTYFSLDEEETETYLYLCRDLLKDKGEFQCTRDTFKFLSDYACLSAANQMELLFRVGRLDLIRRIFGQTWTPDSCPRYYMPICSPFRCLMALVNDFLSDKEVEEMYFLCAPRLESHLEPGSKKSFLRLASLLEDLELLGGDKLTFLRHLLTTIGRADLVKNLQV